MLNHYLIVWGSSVHAVRGGDGKDEREAALDAFGHFDPKRMTFSQQTLSTMRSGMHRLPAIKALLLHHADRMNDDEIRALVAKEINDNINLRMAK